MSEHAYWCRSFDSTATEADCNCQPQPPSPTDQARQRVVDRATEWERHTRGRVYDPMATITSHNLREAVKDYLALTTPAGKRPEETGWYSARHIVATAHGSPEPVFVEGRNVQRVGYDRIYDVSEFELGPRIVLPLEDT